MSFLLANSLAVQQDLTKDTCPKCGEPATVRDASKGIVTCRQGHVTQRDPLTLWQVILNSNSLLKLLKEVLDPYLHLSAFDASGKSSDAFTHCGFDPLGIYDLEGLKILFLVPFKRIRLKDAAMLQGLVVGTAYDSYALVIEGMDKDAEEFLAYTTGGTAQFIRFDDLLKTNESANRLVDSLKTDINIKSTKLYSFLKHELRMAASVTNPDSFRTMIEFNRKLVSDSFEAGTTGNDAEFEDSVTGLLGSFLPVTPLGHRVTNVGPKREIPDGIIQIPYVKKNKLELMFYDCKSIGTERNPKEKKRISQGEEDEFIRYCELFQAAGMNAELTGGIFVAPEFTPQNMINKSLQIRERGRAPKDVQIVFLPLKSLVDLYTRISQERTKFLLHFEPSAIYKLLGKNLSKSDNDKLSQDPEIKDIRRLRESETNSVYISKGL